MIHNEHMPENYHHLTLIFYNLNKQIEFSYKQKTNVYTSSDTKVVDLYQSARTIARCFSDNSFVNRVIVVIIHVVAVSKFFRNQSPHSIVVVGHVPELIDH